MNIPSFTLISLPPSYLNVLLDKDSVKLTDTSKFNKFVFFLLIMYVLTISQASLFSHNSQHYAGHEVLSCAEAK